MAAVTVAGSTFAWFTSTDDVTNRLTASADYGVSIVESFAPPKNLLPGQEVNKDVYAVNTGSIDAFVVETVSGVLNYTYEGLTKDFVANDCLKLTPAAAAAIDGATTNEAGGFLAWCSNPAVTVRGAINSARTGDSVTNTWTPPANGDYIFRRSINTSGATPTYTYAGYHYENGEYYKIVVGTDAFRADFNAATPATAEFDISVDSSKLGAGVTVGEEGVLGGANPVIRYVKEIKVNNAVPKLTYHAEEGQNPAYLVAEFSQNMSDATSALATAQSDLEAAEKALLDDSKIIADAEVEYENAKGAYNSAKSRYDQTKADYDYAVALARATNDLYDAADDRMQVQINKEGALTDESTARTNVNSEAGTLASTYADILDLKADTATISYKMLVQDTGVEAKVNAKASTLPNAKSNMDALSDKWTELKGYAGAIDSALTTLKDTTVTADQSDMAYSTLNTNLNKLLVALDAYNRLYANLKTSTAGESGLTELYVDTDTTAISALLTSSNNMRADVDSDNPAGLAKKVAIYRTATDTYSGYSVATTGNDAVADAAWVAAVDAYNTAVGTAESNYTSAISAIQGELNDFEELQGTAASRTLTNHATNVVPAYSANNMGTEPRLDTTTPPDYANYSSTDSNGQLESKPRKSAGDEDGFEPYNTTTKGIGATLGELKTKMDTAYGAIDSKKTAYDKAVEDKAIHEANKTTAEAAVAAGQRNDKSYIKFIITLEKGMKWTSDNAINAYEARFYYNEVLEAGITSGKLIDKVKLDNGTTANDYKNLTFDLNVGLKSAQVTYADDQTTVKTDAVTPSDFNMTPAVQADNKTITWS